jgi:uncharacterized protein
MNFKPSRHNIISPITSGSEYIIVNVFSGNADFISEKEMNILNQNNSNPYPQAFIDKGYVSDPIAEELEYKLKYIEFLEERDKEEIQIFFVPTYSCNFTCSYCYQSDYPQQKNSFTPELTDAFFDFINQKFGDRNKYITLFGGEPLLVSPQHKKNIEYFISSTKKHKLDIAIVSNGYSLHEYLDLFEPSFVREIQITLDGTREIHNQRRRLKNNDSTFENIVANIDACLNKEIPVNLRMVVDKENMNNLPALADFAMEKGWTEHPLFKTQIGRNYELHYCQHGTSKLYDRLELYQELYLLIKKFPQIVQFHKPAFSVMKFLQENGKLPKALFDSCPACKSEWAMDFSGSIYSCTATVGKPGEKLGTFFPEVSLDESQIKTWQQRDVMHIEKCQDCNLQLICGGGCGSIAFNKNGSILSPDCRPIDGLHSLGAKAYFTDI